MVHIQPTSRIRAKHIRIPPTAVGGWFIRNLQVALPAPSEIPPTAVGGSFIPASLFQLRPPRLGMKHPPAAVGGIRLSFAGFRERRLHMSSLQITGQYKQEVTLVIRGSSS